MEEERTEEHKPEEPSQFDKKLNTTEKIRQNPWMLSTFVLGVLIIVLLIGNFSGMTGSVVSEGEAVDSVLAFVNSQIDGEAELVEVNFDGVLYEVIFLLDGEKSTLYLTSDGKNIIFPQGVLPLSLLVQEEELEEEPENSEISKSDKPVLEAFVSPYCPYGLQYIKGLIPVYNLLKDKADINIKHIGITHMTLEEPETMRQLCILNEYGKNELFAYLENIVYSEEAETCYNAWHQGEYERNDEHFNECMSPIITKAFNKINIDENKINNCIETKGKDYFNSAVEYAHSQNVHSSPTPKINGVQVSGRAPELIKNAVCNAFNKKPEECSTELFSSTPSPGMGGESGADTQAQC